MPTPRNAVSEFEATRGHLQLLSKFGQDIGRMDLKQMHQVALDKDTPVLSQSITELRKLYSMKDFQAHCEMMYIPVPLICNYHDCIVFVQQC